eukprot:TRINITY_DN5740_c0_g2_i14.p1 TRINITY_DN5740_c0_g2~~TRINITY_DN5740_c0_g2_i14.p1  ORF type:complete len:607 (+),score=116.74 TRINITY_DN5740_c0_g2_i14:1437-3257(+)
MVGEILYQLISFCPKNPRLKTYCLEIVSSCCTFYEKNPMTIERILEVVLGGVTFPLPYPPNSEVVSKEQRFVMDEVFETRKQGCISLLILCKAVSQKLLPYLPLLMNKIDELKGFSGLQQNNHVFLMQSLIEISNAFNNYTQQLEFLKCVLKSYILEWQSESLSRVLMDVPSFLSFLGVGKLKGGPEDYMYLSNSRSLFRLIQSFCLLWKCSKIPTDATLLSNGGYYEHNSTTGTVTHDRPKHPLVELDKLIMENLFKFILILHTTWSPSVKTCLPNEWQVIYYPKENLASALKVEIEYPNRDAPDWNVRADVHYCVGLFFEFGYGVVGEIIRHEAIFSLHNLVENLSRSVFTNLDHLDFEKKGLFIENVIQPIVVFCPVHLYEQILPLAFDAAFQMFKSISHALLGLTEKNVQTSNEMVDDYLLRVTVRKYVSMVEDIFFGTAGPAQRMEFLISTHYLPHFIESIIFCLRFIDSRARTMTSHCLISTMKFIEKNVLRIGRNLVDGLFVDATVTCLYLLSKDYDFVTVEIMAAMLLSNFDAVSLVLHKISGIHKDSVDTLVNSVRKTPEKAATVVHQFLGEQLQGPNADLIQTGIIKLSETLVKKF